MMLLVVVVGSMVRSASLPDSAPTEGTDRIHPPGIPDTYHRLDTRV
jgi:hypothetical protein